MNAAQILKYLKWSNGRWVMCWRHPVTRYGCNRSRHFVSGFPTQADLVARRVVEAVSPLTKKQKPHVIGGLK